MTSMAIPGIFPYSEEKGNLLVDAGPTSAVPVFAVRYMGADIVIAVSLRGKLRKEIKPTTGLEIHLRIDEIVTTRLIETQTLTADVVIRPDVEDVHWADFSRIDYCIEKGYEAAQEAIPQIKKALLRKSSLRSRMRVFFSKRKKDEVTRFQKTL
jgi:NTE family protein